VLFHILSLNYQYTIVLQVRSGDLRVNIEFTWEQLTRGTGFFFLPTSPSTFQIVKQANQNGPTKYMWQKYTEPILQFQV